jgi:hypothetical protein
MRRIVSDLCFVAALLLGIVCVAQAQYNSFPPGVFNSREALDPAGGGGGGGCSDSATFLARGTFDGTHTTAYQNFICGLNTDGIGIFTSQWDVLVILGTQNTTVAALNLPSTNFSPTPNGSPTPITDRGYQGVDASSTVYLDTNYNPIVNAVNYSQNAASVSIWSIDNPTASASGGTCMALINGSGGTRIFPKYSDTKTYADINTATTGSMASLVNAAGPGLFFVDRTGTTENLYYNGNTSPLVGPITNTSGSSASANVIVLASVASGVFSFGCSNTIAAYSIGNHFTAAQMASFYGRLRTFGTALGWP